MGTTETVVPEKLVGIDEMRVEWCVRCGKEGERNGMELEEFEWGVEGEQGRRKGFWWVCRGECPR